MLQSLEIRNYRNLRHLTIEKLGRVNLLVGKNNTGKTSVLEAVAVYLNKGNINFILQLLEERGENYIRVEPYASRVVTETTKENALLKTISAIFNGRVVRFSDDDRILIGELQDTLFGSMIDPHNRLSIRFVKYVEEYDETIPGQPTRRRRNYLVGDDNESEFQLGVEIRSAEHTNVLPFRMLDRINRGISTINSGLQDDRSDNFQFVRTKNIDRDANGSLWDRIALTDNEEDVVDALKIVESDIDRVTFRTERKQERVAVVKLKSSNDVVPLRSMGDGINRILTIILAMVNCESGYLLIDEFENGLHYSVQEKLWKIIFHLSERLNIQVFATTHSLDCVEAFSAVLNDSKQHRDAGVMVRLENYDGNISATVYDADEIQSTTRVHVDPR